MTAEPAFRVERKEATRPWTWKRGMINMVRSVAVNWYVWMIFSSGNSVSING